MLACLPCGLTPPGSTGIGARLNTFACTRGAPAGGAASAQEGSDAILQDVTHEDSLRLVECPH